MNHFDRKNHWDNFYNTKPLDQSSWYQPVPDTSLAIMDLLQIPLTARIIDVGAGDSFFVDYLLDRGYRNITVVDISEAAVKRAQQRLATRSGMVKWIIADAADFHPTEEYDFWHDRAAFHFLTLDEEIKKYIDSAQKHIRPGGYLVIGTFSENGPEICSGIHIRQYSEKSMTQVTKSFFEKVNCFTVDHHTPSGSIQNFIFCIFRRFINA